MAGYLPGRARPRPTMTGGATPVMPTAPSPVLEALARQLQIRREPGAGTRGAEWLAQQPQGPSAGSMIDTTPLYNGPGWNNPYDTARRADGEKGVASLKEDQKAFPAQMTRQRMGQLLQREGGAITPANRKQILGMLTEIGAPIASKDVLDDPTIDTTPEYEWVTRNGTPTQIQKGTAVAGDAPYEKPSTSAGLGAANSRLRNNRIATALNSVENLKALAPERTPGPQGLLEGARDTAASWAGLNSQTRQYNALLQPTAMQMAVAVQGAANLSDSERTAMAGMLGNIATMDYETQMALLDSAVETLKNSGEVIKQGDVWVPTERASATGIGRGGPIQMTTPDGRTIMVPPEQVEEARARGAK